MASNDKQCQTTPSNAKHCPAMQYNTKQCNAMPSKSKQQRLGSVPLLGVAVGSFEKQSPYTRATIPQLLTRR
eukprot:7989164-Pyramimonas_sp.AAC.1